MVKSNLDAKPCSIGFREAPPEIGPRIEWLGQSDLSADDLLQGANKRSKHPALSAAEDFLKMTLHSLVESPWNKLAEMAAKQGIAEITLRRARDTLGLEKKAAGNHQYVWELPQELWLELEHKH
jgi:hypothetical protein